jgi:CubicO group peptidase (beta-lactamase class C family)
MRRLTAAVLAFLVPCALSAQAPAPSAPDSGPDIPRLDSIVRANMASRHLVGVSLGLMKDGRVVLQRSYGTADLATNAPVNLETRFAIGSVTKEFICALVLQLAEEHRLSLDDKVAMWFPDLTRATDIAVRDLMGHVSGYPDYYPLDFLDQRMLRPIAADSLIRWYGRQPLDFEPVTRWSYSNTGFIMLGRIAERVTGRSLERLLRERIFRPVGMTHTTYEPESTGGPEYARGYASFALSPVERAEPEGRGWAAAAGGIWSTPGDLLRWDKALMEGRVVHGEFLRQMTSARMLTGGGSSHYGFGLSIGMAGGDTVWSHGGAVSGFAAQNVMLPRTRTAVVILSNAEASVPSGPILRTVASLLPAPRRDTTHHEPTANPRPVPTIQGPGAKDMATTLFHQIQAGQVDRGLLGEEYRWWLTDARIAGAAQRLGPLAEPARIETNPAVERGGMEVTVTRFVFPTLTLAGLMYRTPDGKVQEFLLSAQ